MTAKDFIDHAIRTGKMCKPLTNRDLIELKHEVYSTMFNTTDEEIRGVCKIYLQWIHKWEGQPEPKNMHIRILGWTLIGVLIITVASFIWSRL